MKVDPAQFDVHSDGIRIVSMSFNIAWYTNHDFGTIIDDVLTVYRKFFDVCPTEKLIWYITENMTRYKSVTSRAFDLLPKWLNASGRPRPFIHVNLKDGRHYADTPGYAINVLGKHEGATGYGMHANLIRYSLPPYVFHENLDKIIELIREICYTFPFQSGHAGYCIENSGFFQEQSHTSAWTMSMLHPGLDIANDITDVMGVGRDGIKGVNWLTMLSGDLLRDVGGYETLRADLPRDVELIDVPYGVIIRATPLPIVGGLDADDAPLNYKAVFRVVRPLIERTLKRYGAFDLPGGDHAEKTRDWLMRLEDG